MEVSSRGVKAGESPVEVSSRGVKAGGDTVEVSSRGLTAGESPVEVSARGVTAGANTVEVSSRGLTAGESPVEVSARGVKAGGDTVEETSKLTSIRIKRITESLRTHGRHHVSGGFLRFVHPDRPTISPRACAYKGKGWRRRRSRGANTPQRGTTP